MNKLFAIFALTLISAMGFAQKTLLSDPYHSRIQFRVIHLTLSDITGNFEKSTLKIQEDEKNFLNSKINFEIDVNSINTHVEPRDKHLKSADFFDVEKFPKASFTSSSIKKRKKNFYDLQGNLTMHGVTKPVQLTLVYRGTTTNPNNKKTTHGYQVSGTLKRSDFAIGGNFPEAMISDNVRITGDFEMTEK